MRLLIDDRWLGPTGIGRFAEEVLERSPGNVKIVGTRKWALNHPLTPWYLGREIDREKPDIMWSPSFMPPQTRRVPFVITIHDLIHLHFHSSAHKAYYNCIIRPLAKRAFKIVTVSEFSRRQIVEWSSLPPERVVVVNNGVSKNFASDGEVFMPNYSYLLYVGNRRSHKNIKRMLSAFASASIDKKICLAISGMPDPETTGISRGLSIEDRIKYLGFITEDDLPKVYRGALALIYPSLYEGSGIPPLEAMACGTPVLSSNVTSLPEVIGDAGILVDPYSEEAIAQGIETITSNTEIRKELRNKGLAKARLFTWDCTAKKVWEVLSEAVGIELS